MSTKYIFHNIALKTHVYERLEKHGKFKQTHSEIVEEILDKVEKNKTQEMDLAGPETNQKSLSVKPQQPDLTPNDR